MDIRDPISDKFFTEVWMKTAKENTSIYEKVFNCIPTDSVPTFAKLRQYLSQPILAKAEPDIASNLLQKVKGYLVQFPLNFLCSENLTPAPGTKEALMPVCLWT
nr:phospholipase D2 ScoTox-alphaI [Hemiscorpius lepturus]